METRAVPNRNPIAYPSAAAKDHDVLRELTLEPAAQNVYNFLWRSKTTIALIVKYHLDLQPDDECWIAPSESWMRGAFNICVLVNVKRRGQEVKQFVFRCPMPHMHAETKNPGTVDEKLSCEAAMYAWMQEMCPDVRIPFLYGFGFSDGRHYTHMSQCPFFARWARMSWRQAYRALQKPMLSGYISNSIVPCISTGYMLLEHMGPPSQMLSSTWDNHRHHPIRRQNVFSGIARLMISLARIPQQKIGALRFNADCTVTLSNRPLTCLMMNIENRGVDRVVDRDTTYTSTEPFVADLLELHDRGFINNPNAVRGDTDCLKHMANRTILRALAPFYIRQDRRNGPYVLQLTDLHQSNIFVDGESNVACILDLEWICSLPAEMLMVPSWISPREEFLRAIEREEPSLVERPFLGRIMQETRLTGGTWFWRCLRSANGHYTYLRDFIQQNFGVRSDQVPNEFVARLWSPRFAEYRRKKIADRERYKIDLRLAFGIDALPGVRQSRAV